MRGQELVEVVTRAAPAETEADQTVIMRSTATICVRWPC